MKIRYVEAMVQQLTTDLSFGDEDGPFVPVGSNEPIDTLLRREGLDSADLVAIVRLSDLEMLIANQRSVA